MAKVFFYNEDCLQNMKRMAEKAFRTLRMDVYARADFIEKHGKDRKGDRIL